MFEAGRFGGLPAGEPSRERDPIVSWPPVWAPTGRRGASRGRMTRRHVHAACPRRHRCMPCSWTEGDAAKGAQADPLRSGRPDRSGRTAAGRWARLDYPPRLARSAWGRSPREPGCAGVKLESRTWRRSGGASHTGFRKQAKKRAGRTGRPTRLGEARAAREVQRRRSAYPPPGTSSESAKRRLSLASWSGRVWWSRACPG